MTTTTYYGFALPNFNLTTWHDELNGNFTQIDTLLYNILGMSVSSGNWANSTTYTVDDIAFDNVTFEMYRCLVGHTSPATGTFSAARIATPTEWVLVDIGLTIRGAWAATTDYILADVVYDTSEHIVCICSIAHTSTTDIRTDIANWDILADLKASVDAAAASAASVNFPDPPVALNYVRQNAGATAWENRTPVEVTQDLSVEVGVDTQAFDATLDSIAALGTGADKLTYTTGVDTWAETTITAFGRSLLDDAAAVNGRATLGVVINTDVQAFDATLLSIAALGTAANKLAYTTGVDTWAELDFLDEDDMSSDSATAVASQQSLKAYVDANMVPNTNGYRITLASGEPVPTTDKTAIASVWATPYNVEKIALYDGTSSWIMVTPGELSIALSGGTASKPHDVHMDYNGGSPQLVLTAWSDDETRVTENTRQDGVWVQTGNTDWRWLGTIYLDASKQCEDSLTSRMCWNVDNRVPRPMRRIESTDSWTYTILTWRQVLASSLNQFNFVIGLSEDEVSVDVQSQFANSTASIAGYVGVGLDSTSAIATGSIAGSELSVVSHWAPLNGSWTGFPGIGKHYLAWLEASVATGVGTWYGDSGTPAFMQAGMFGRIIA